MHPRRITYMTNITAKIRKTGEKNNSELREKGFLPAVLYGPKTESRAIAVDVKELQKAHKEAGESSLITLELDKKEYPVLIHDLKIDPISGQPIHADFYQPDLEKKIEASIPIILDGEAPAVKALGGTLYKNVSEVEVKALPNNLPREIRIDISQLNTLEDHIKIKDLKVGEGVEVLGEPEEIIVSVSAPEDVEEELAKPVEEKVEEVEKIEKEKKEEEAEQGAEEPKEEKKE
jgi:large subunit ribosomal protein L25